MLTEAQKKKVRDAVDKASEMWKDGFNSGNAQQCASLYENDAVMEAKPFGVFTGHDQIRGFWQKLIDDGFTDVQYVGPVISVMDTHNAILTSDWKMNKASGTIHKEHWVIQADGSAKLREDSFEAAG